MLARGICEVGWNVIEAAATLEPGYSKLKMAHY